MNDKEKNVCETTLLSFLLCKNRIIYSSIPSNRLNINFKRYFFQLNMIH